MTSAQAPRTQAPRTVGKAASARLLSPLLFLLLARGGHGSHGLSAGANATGAGKSSPYAYAFVVGPILEDSVSHKGYLYGVLVAVQSLRDAGSEADFWIWLDISPESKLRVPPAEDLRLLNELGVRFAWDEQRAVDAHETGRANFGTITFSKFFRLLPLVEYRRVIFLDSDVIPIANMDYLFTLSDGPDPLLRPNVILASRGEPCNTAVFMLQPEAGAVDRLLDVVNMQRCAGLNLPYPHFDWRTGWGHNFRASRDHWEAVQLNGTSWRFHCGWSDQGLWYHYMKYVAQDVSVFIGDRVQNWQRGGSEDMPRLERQFSAPSIAGQGTLLPTELVRTRKRACGGRPHTSQYTACVAPYSSFVHLAGAAKPWMSQAPNESARGVQSAMAFGRVRWFQSLRLLNRKHTMGLDLDEWDSKHRPQLMKASVGLAPKWSDIAATVNMTVNTYGQSAGSDCAATASRVRRLRARGESPRGRGEPWFSTSSPRSHHPLRPRAARDAGGGATATTAAARRTLATQRIRESDVVTPLSSCTFLPPADVAVMALLAASTPGSLTSYSLGLRVLGKSVFDHAPSVPRYLMVAAGTKMSEVEGWKTCQPNNISHATKVGRWRHTFQKYTIFALVQFQRILFLDADTLVVGSLEELWRWPIPNGISLSAIQDQQRGDKRLPFWHPNQTWVSAPWFNTGVMLARPNAKFYRELLHATSTHDLPFLKDGVSHVGGAVQSEQDILNGLVGPNWVKLPRRFNAGHSLRAMQSEWDAAIPMHILHFTLFKPWTESRCNRRVVELCEQWKAVRRKGVVRRACQTPWSMPPCRLVPPPRGLKCGVPVKLLEGRRRMRPQAMPQSALPHRGTPRLASRGVSVSVRPGPASRLSCMSSTSASR